MCGERTEQPRLFALPPMSEIGSTLRGETRSETIAESTVSNGMGTQDRPKFELILRYNGITSRKTWTLPSSWLRDESALLIGAAYVDSAISDVGKNL